MKNNEIVRTAADALSIGEVFFKSGLFQDIKSVHQAVVKILAGQEMGISPMASMNGIHIIAGKPVVGAGLMAARVKSFGKYDYKVKQHDDKACSIEFFQGKESLGVSTFTIDDAKKAGTKNLDKFPRNMLFARAMSNGVKWYTPDIYEQPVYVPEEMVDIKPDITDKQLLQAIKRITEGEMEVGQKCLDNFNLTEDQRKAIENAMNAFHNVVNDTE
jgi:hypothetical protein